MVSLLSSKIGGPEGFAPILSSDELLCGGQLHMRYSHSGFSIFFAFFLWFIFFGVELRVLQWPECKSCHQPPKKKQQVTQLQEDVCRHSWVRDMDGRWLTRSSSTLLQILSFILLGVHIIHPPHQKTCTGGEDGLVADNPTMKQVTTGLHGTCSKSLI